MLCPTDCESLGPPGVNPTTDQASNGRGDSMNLMQDGGYRSALKIAFWLVIFLLAMGVGFLIRDSSFVDGITMGAVVLAGLLVVAGLGVLVDRVAGRRSRS
jgi:hypothetical protein